MDGVLVLCLKFYIHVVGRCSKRHLWNDSKLVHQKLPVERGITNFTNAAVRQSYQLVGIDYGPKGNTTTLLLYTRNISSSVSSGNFIRTSWQSDKTERWSCSQSLTPILSWDWSAIDPRVSYSTGQRADKNASSLLSKFRTYCWQDSVDNGSGQLWNK